MKNKKGWKELRYQKEYTLDDGTVVTAAQVAEKVFLTRENARTRLTRFTSPERIWARKGQRVFMSELDTEVVEKPKTILCGIQLEPAREPDSTSYTIEMYARAAWLQENSGSDFLYHPDEDEDLPCPSWKEGQE
tara:strand:- start:130 stop:531 length:402 start_codon:yes stop_codon:yes gene_type:complete